MWSSWIFHNSAATNQNHPTQPTPQLWLEMPPWIFKRNDRFAMKLDFSSIPAVLPFVVVPQNPFYRMQVTEKGGQGGGELRRQAGDNWINQYRVNINNKYWQLYNKRMRTWNGGGSQRLLSQVPQPATQKCCTSSFDKIARRAWIDVCVSTKPTTRSYVTDIIEELYWFALTCPDVRGDRFRIA